MARGINKVILIGNLGNEPEVRYTASGVAMTTLSLATSDSWKDKETGQMQEKTEWHRVVFFNRLAEICGEYLHKGSKVYVEGALRTRKWTDKNGQERYTTEVMANSMQMLDSKGTGAPAFGGQQSMASSSNNPHESRASAPMEAVMGGADDFDDDIPF